MRAKRIRYEVQGNGLVVGGLAFLAVVSTMCSTSGRGIDNQGGAAGIDSGGGGASGSENQGGGQASGGTSTGGVGGISASGGVGGTSASGGMGSTGGMGTGGMGTGGMGTGGKGMGGMGTGGVGITGGMGMGGMGMGGMGMGGSNPTACTAVPKLKLSLVVDNASDPIFFTQPAGDSRFYVVERRGVIRLVANGKVSTTPFADFRNNVANPGGSERGLLGLAFHPDYANNGRFFVYYTAKNGDTVSGGDEGDLIIAEGKRSADANKAENTLKMLKRIDHSEHSNHNGGMINFGKDGMLYAGTGDGGGGGDPFTAGQNTQNPLGKMLRIDVDNPNARPAGNMAAPADLHVWAVGLRNPWRWSFDKSTGDLFIGDVGQDEWEEIDYVKNADFKAGLNFGWSAMEGKHCYRNNCDMSGKILPVVEYANPPGNQGRSVTGGYIYRGANIPCLVGHYLYADDITNQVWSFILKNGQAADEKELTADLTEGGVQIGDVAAFGQDAAGELYIVARASGRVYRIDAE